MAVLKTKMQGDSMSIGIAFNAEYDTSRIENHYLYLNNKLFPTTLVNGIVRAELTSEQTKAFIGNVRLTVVIDDIHFGVRKTDVGYIEFKTTPTIYDQSINEGYDLVVTMTVNESSTGVSITVLEAFRGYSAYELAVSQGYLGTLNEWLSEITKGDKGDAFTYEDFTPEQLASLKGEPFVYSDFTLGQLDALRGDAFTYEDFTPEQLEALKGNSGLNAFEVWKAISGNENKTIDNYIASLKGDAFTYEDFTPEQLAALKGDKGDTFTYEDFTTEQLAALKGQKGDAGVDSIMPISESFTGIHVLTQAAYDTLVTNSQIVSTVLYFVYNN